jgi:hypothetical protein
MQMPMIFDNFQLKNVPANTLKRVHTEIVGNALVPNGLSENSARTNSSSNNLRPHFGHTR